MNKKEKQRFEELENFGVEVKQMVRNLGRSNFISIRELEELFVKYNISVKKNERRK